MYLWYKPRKFKISKRLRIEIDGGAFERHLAGSGDIGGRIRLGGHLVALHVEVLASLDGDILLGFERVGEGVGKNALNVFTVYFKLQSFVFMPIFGLNSGMVPILSYNYGANKPKRVFATMRIAYVTAVSYVLLCLAAFQLLPDQLLSIFNASSAMLEIGRVALRTISLSFLFAGFSIISISACQALGKSIYSLFVSIGRQLVVLIPASYLLSLTNNINLVWWAFPIAEVMSLILCIIFLLVTLKQAFSKGEHNYDE